MVVSSSVTQATRIRWQFQAGWGFRASCRASLSWHLAHRRCLQLVALRILTAASGLGVPHTVTWLAQVTQIVQTALKLEGIWLVPPHPSPAPASQETDFLPQLLQGDTGLGGEQLTHGPQTTHAHSHRCACPPSAGARLAQRPPLGPHPLLPARLQPPLHNYVWYFPVYPAWGEPVRGAMSSACTWASARGEPAEQPSRLLPAHREGRAGPRLSKSLGGTGWSGGARQGHTPREAREQAAQVLPGSTATHGGQTGLDTLPVHSGASKGIGQCPTGHGWAPTASPGIQAHPGVSHLCTSTVYMGHSR